MQESPGPAPLTRIERWSLAAAGFCLVAMMVVITAEVVARSVFSYCFEAVDEIGGYLLVAVSFLGFAPALALGSLHSVSFLQDRLSARANRLLAAVFALLATAFAATLTFAIGRYVWRTWQAGAVASTTLQTPLWVPQLTMVVGMSVLVMALVRQLLAHLRAGNEGVRRDG